MKIKLKPCPFCGNKAYIKQTSTGYASSYHYAGYSIGCDHCGIRLTDESTFTIEDGVVKYQRDGYAEIIKKWNTRF